MNITLFDNFGNSSTIDVSSTIIHEVGSSLIKHPKIVDGMGDKLVICNCKFCEGSVFTNFAEIIVLEYEKECGERVCKNFFGYDSYSIQSGIHELEKSR